MKTIRFTVTLLSVGLISMHCYSQGFINLNFEQAHVVPIPPFLNTIYTTNAIPGWTAYIGGASQSTVGYDTTSLGGAGIYLEDSNNFIGITPLQGNYSILLGGSTSGTPTSAAIGQTGLIPLNAVSLLFDMSLDSSLQVTFDGQPIPLVEVSSTPNYQVMAGNISAFAGDTGQLLFTALGGTETSAEGGILDDIQFSSSPVPEPGALGLAALGGLLLVWRCRKARAV